MLGDDCAGLSANMGDSPLLPGAETAGEEPLLAVQNREELPAPPVQKVEGILLLTLAEETLPLPSCAGCPVGPVTARNTPPPPGHELPGGARVLVRMSP